MQSNWAVENLQVIRTLMERSALYRRALAPIMLTVGIIGILAGICGHFLKTDSMRNFISLWLITSAVAVITSFLLVRRQAMKDREPFWSPPTRRVAFALAPPLLVGFCFSILLLLSDQGRIFPPISAWALPGLWMILYGCALHSAGFVMARGIRLLGWTFVFAGLIALLKTGSATASVIPKANFSMALVFGGLHLVAGVYLYFTEKKTTAA
ncbi:MAG: hypothetical protein ABIQ35_04415 [Verrucomicrobiota bacterium]